MWIFNWGILHISYVSGCLIYIKSTELPIKQIKHDETYISAVGEVETEREQSEKLKDYEIKRLNYYNDKNEGEITAINENSWNRKSKALTIEDNPEKVFEGGGHACSRQ